MFGLAAAALDVLHAIFMVMQVAGLPLLFWHRWPRLTRAYAIYAISFIVLNQLSKFALDECFLTTLARMLWARAVVDPADVPSEWFTVRLAQWVFHQTPSHRAVALAGELLMFVTAIGVLVWRRNVRHARQAHVRDDDDHHLPLPGAPGAQGAHGAAE
jgi:hypothetical protein